MGEGAGAALGGLLLTLERLASLQATTLQEVCEHLTFALHSDLPTANKVVAVGDESVDVLSHLV